MVKKQYKILCFCVKLPHSALIKKVYFSKNLSTLPVLRGQQYSGLIGLELK